MGSWLDGIRVQGSGSEIEKSLKYCKVFPPCPEAGYRGARLPGALPCRRSLTCFGFQLRVSGFEFRVSGCGLRASGFGFRASGFGFQVSGIGFRNSGFGLRLRVEG